MNHRVVYECAPPRRRIKPAAVLTPAIALLVAAIVVGEWACAPHVAQGPRPTASASFVATATAAPLAQQASAPQPAAAGSGSMQPATLSQLDPKLADALRAEAREDALRRLRAERDSAAAEAAEHAFPVRDRMEMSSTKYCLKGQMRTGVHTRDGMAAGDPRVLPLGSVVRVTHPDGRLIGIFVIMDTGGAIKGNKIDLYVDSCREAEDWGRRPVVAEVLDTGIRS
jgi:3D (Asp-Asp-Asp) domain-containing protein